jgi:hypothetical protein
MAAIPSFENRTARRMERCPKSFWKRASTDDEEQKSRKVMGRLPNDLGDACQVVGGGARIVFRMGVPVTDVVEPLSMVLEDLLLFGSAMWPEREAAPAISRARACRGHNIPIVGSHPSEKLATGFSVEEAILPMRFKDRKRIRIDSDRD